MDFINTATILGVAFNQYQNLGLFTIDHDILHSGSGITTFLIAHTAFTCRYAPKYALVHTYWHDRTNFVIIYGV